MEAIFLAVSLFKKMQKTIRTKQMVYCSNDALEIRNQNENSFGLKRVTYFDEKTENWYGIKDINDLIRNHKYRHWMNMTWL